MACRDFISVSRKSIVPIFPFVLDRLCLAWLASFSLSRYVGRLEIVGHLQQAFRTGWFGMYSLFGHWIRPTKRCRQWYNVYCNFRQCCSAAICVLFVAVTILSLTDLRHLVYGPEFCYSCQPHLPDSAAIHADLRKLIPIDFGHNSTGKLNIGILMLYNNTREDAEFRYSSALRTVRCYGRYHGYGVKTLFADDLDKFILQCPQHDFFFRRHCIARYILPNYDWLLSLDGDTGIVNPYHRLERFVDNGVHVILYDRFYNHEIAAINYFVRNDTFAYDFLLSYAQMEVRQISPFPGRDNGALHIHLLETLESNSTFFPLCTWLFNKAANSDEFFLYEACVRLALNEQRYFPGKLMIAAKGQGWVRDAWITEGAWSHKDFFLHSWREWFANTYLSRRRWLRAVSPLPQVDLCSQPGANLVNLWTYAPALYQTADWIGSAFELLKRESDRKYDEYYVRELRRLQVNGSGSNGRMATVLLLLAMLIGGTLSCRFFRRKKKISDLE